MLWIMEMFWKWHNKDVLALDHLFLSLFIWDTSGCGQMSANAQIYIRNVNVKQRVYVKYKCITCSSLVLLTHTDSYVLYIKHV